VWTHYSVAPTPIAATTAPAGHVVPLTFPNRLILSNVFQEDSILSTKCEMSSLSQVAQFRRVEDRSLAQVVAEQIRREIVAGRLREGTRLLEADLAEQMGTSRAPVRQALQRLSLEGLLESRQRRGFVVRAFSWEAIEELCDLRLHLEPALFAAAAERVDGDGLALLGETVARLRAAVMRADWPDVVAADRNFHSLVARFSGRVYTAQAFAILAEPLTVFMEVMRQQHSNTQDWIDDHEALLERLRQGDGVGAAGLIREHLERDREEIRQAIRSQA
jgi:DNA-binding GntR family transcriptional regulator